MQRDEARRALLQLGAQAAQMLYKVFDEGADPEALQHPAKATRRHPPLNKNN